MINEKTVLVVDDDPAVRRMYVNFIYSYGLTVFEAASAEEATEIMMRVAVDVILLDINMPEIDGRTAFEVIRCFGTRTKVIVTSVLPTDVQKRMLPQADDYHDKAHGMYPLLCKIQANLDTAAFNADSARSPHGKGRESAWNW